MKLQSWDQMEEFCQIQVQLEDRSESNPKILRRRLTEDGFFFLFFLIKADYTANVKPLEASIRHHRFNAGN